MADEAGPGAGRTVPLPREEVAPLVEEHLGLFARVLTEAWDTYAQAVEAAPAQMSRARASSRAMLVSDYLRAPALRLFADQPGAQVRLRCQQPWVSLAGGTVQVRFRKLSASLELAPVRTGRARSLSWHLGDPLYDDEPVGTVLTAGYVLDPSETRLSRLALVCHVGEQVHYWIDLPQDGLGSEPGPVELPMAPLSEPVIRRAREHARRQDATGQDRRASGE